MKLIIETQGQGKATITLNWNGEEYTEHWIADGCLCEDSIVGQMEQDGINVEGTDIELLIDNIEMSEYISLADREREWEE